MTRFKRRKIAGIMRVCILVAVPFGAALLSGQIPEIRRTFAKLENIRIGKELHEENFSEQPIYGKKSGESVLSADMILSEGYGVNEETYEAGKEIHLLSPLEMVSENPGEKPYPTEWTVGGDIIRNTYEKFSGDSFFDLDKGGQVNNKTSIPNDTLYDESFCLPNYKVEDTDEPLVLLYHTHTTESFEPCVRDNYDAEFNYRTTDETKNMVMVGDAIEAELKAKGIGVIHVRTIHDYPSYNGSYERSRESIVPILEEYPSIKVVLDIHRDAISGEGFAYQPYTVINGREAAQIMIISGCDDGTMDMPEYMKNFHFACNLQQQLESDFEGLTRPILFDYRHYNQDLTTGSLLIEVGSHGNTLEQVQYSGQLIGRSLGDLLNRLKEM